MVIGSCNVDDILVNELANYHTVVTADEWTEQDVILIDWIPTNHKNKRYASKIILQSLLVKKYAKIKTIVIFDRYLSITYDEYRWLKNKNIILLEPAINNRRNFVYMPSWIRYKSNKEISLKAPQKTYDVMYDGSPSDNIIEFEEYLLRYCKESSSNRKVCYNQTINDAKINEYNDSGLVFDSGVDYSQSKFILLLSTLRNYRIGYLHPNISKILNANCIPLIVDKHRYYNAMSGVVNSLFCISSYTQSYDNLYWAYMTEAYDKIKEFYPEMLVENVAISIKKMLKGI